MARLLRTTTFSLGVPVLVRATMIQGGPGLPWLRSMTVLLTMRESRMPRKLMPCQWSVTTTLFSTTQFTKNPSKQPIACIVLRSGWLGFTWLMNTLPRRVTPRTSPVPTPPGPTDQLWKPSSWLVSGGSFDVVVLDAVVLEQAVVAQPAQAVGGEAVDQVLLDARRRAADADPEPHVAHAAAADGHAVGVHPDPAGGDVHPVGRRPGRRASAIENTSLSSHRRRPRQDRRSCGPRRSRS